MKLKHILLTILATMTLLLAACTPLNSSPEERQNRLEAYLINRANGYNDVKAPNIYGLSDDQKKEIINGLAHDVVMGTEGVLIDYLNEQWPAWRSADGFLLEHLNYIVSLSEKAVQKMPQQNIDIKQMSTATDLKQFYASFDQLLRLHQIEHNSLYVVNGSLYYDWQYRNALLSLERVEMTLVNLPAAQTYSLLYENGQISLKTINSQVDLYGHLTLSESIRLVDEKALLPLVKQAELAVMSVEFSTDALSATNCGVAVKTGSVFLPTAELVDGTVVGDVSFNRIVEQATSVDNSVTVQETEASASAINGNNSDLSGCYKLIVPVQLVE